MTRIVLLLSLMASATGAYGQLPEIVVEGRFEDWTDRQPIYTDPQDQTANEIDFERVWVDNDDHFLYVSIVVGASEIGLQDDGSFTMYLDSDNDPSTGESFAGIGADLVWRFGDREGTFTAGSASVTVTHEHIGLIPAPSVTSARFELALDLDAEPRRLGPLFPGDTLALAFGVPGGGDILPEEGDRVEFAIDRSVDEREYNFEIGREQPSDLRVLAWNVERDGFFDDGRLSAYTNLLTAIDPDVIGFSEIYDHSVAQTLDRLETILPSGQGESWYGSGTGWDVVIASRYPVIGSFQLERRAAAGGYILDLSSRGADRLFIVVAHLRCCEADFERQLQIDEVMAFIRDAKADGTLAENTPIVIVGDMNFVGDSRQVKTLTDGDIVNTQFQPSFAPDWDDTPFADRIPLTTGRPAAITWPGRGEEFAPGRLDFVVYSDHVMEAGAAFSLDTRYIPLDRLQLLGLSASNSIVASDHLPVIADFRGSRVTSNEPDPAASPNRHSSGLSVYPNPAVSQVTIEFQAGSSGSPEIEIFDVLGRSVRSKPHTDLNGRLHRVTFDVTDFPSGLYVVRTTNSTRLHPESAVLIVR